MGPRLLAVRTSFMSGGSIVEYWFPFDGHPDGESELAWFRVCEGRGLSSTRKSGWRVGQRGVCFTVIDGWAYPCLSMPGDPPTFQIIGSFVYAPTGTAWFRIDRARPSRRPASTWARPAEPDIAGTQSPAVRGEHSARAQPQVFSAGLVARRRSDARRTDSLRQRRTATGAISAALGWLRLVIRSSEGVPGDCDDCPSARSCQWTRGAEMPAIVVEVEIDVTIEPDVSGSLKIQGDQA